MTEGERLIAMGRAEGRAEGKAEGRLEGQAEAVLRFLARRSVRLTPEEQAQITDCEDAEQMTRWLDAAATATSAEDLFGPTKH